MSKKDLKMGGIDTAKEVKTIKVEELEITEPSREDIPTITISPEQQFINAMQEDTLPPEAKGRNQYIFHRETGRQLVSFKEIYQDRKHAFEVWAKSEEYALELFKKRTQWKKRKGDTPCPIPKED